MAFLTSTQPDISESLPASFSSRVQAVASSTSKVRFDIEIAGIGFCIQPETNATGLSGYLRQSVAVQKPQQDTSKEPGEQSLDGYWVRSQGSWHLGAGINFYEPGSQTETQYRFTESSGVDVWTPGKATLLPRLALRQAVGGNCYVQDAGNGYVVFTDDTSVTGWGGSSYALTTPTTGHNGRYYWFGYKRYVKVGWQVSPSPTVGVWSSVTNTVVAKNATVEPKVWFLKDRGVVSHGSRLYEVPLNAPTPVDLSDAAASLYNAVDATASWVDVVEGPNGIYGTMLSGGKSSIVRFALDNPGAGATPKLGQGGQVLVMPDGEDIYKTFSYLGRYLVMSTSAGVRVCLIDSSGGLTLGQVNIPAATTGRLTTFHADGDFVYVGGADVPRVGTSGGNGLLQWSTTAGFIRINLGQPVGDPSTLRFAYANDTRSDVNGVATSSVRSGTGKQYLAIAGSGIWGTDTLLVQGGYLAGGRVRYSTYINKIFRSVDLAGDTAFGSVGFQMLDENDSSRFQLTMTAVTGVYDSVSLDLTRAYRYVRPVVVLTAGAAGTPSPSITQVQLRALPSPPRLRQFRFPLVCNNREEDANGLSFGYEGFAFDRVSLMEELEEAGVPVSILDRRTGETLVAMIDEIRYLNTTPPDRRNRNYGGSISLSVTRL